MKHLKSKSTDLLTIFRNDLTVAHIMENLQSKDAAEIASTVREQMISLDFDVVGVTKEGIVQGYLKQNELITGECEQFIHYFAASDLIADSTPLLDALILLRHQPRYFVLQGNKVEGIVMRGDLQKAPVRMLLFGLITLTEMNLLKAIRLYFPGESWELKLKPNRIEKAKDLLSERRGRNEAIDLADCLQLGDKFDLFSQHQNLLKETGFSRAKINRIKERTNKLRDRLAHGQDLVVGSSWEKIIDTVAGLESLLTNLEEALVNSDFQF